MARRIAMYQHDCRDKNMLTRMGVTTRGTEVWLNKRVAEADKVILLNALSTHDMAGFGGGRKLVLPGVAGWDTIQQNHCHALGDEVGSGLNPDSHVLKTEGNPVSEDMQEGCDMLRPCFLVHSLINADGEVSGMVGGDLLHIPQQGAGLEQAAEVGIRIENELECVDLGDNQYGHWLGFAPLTLVPIATEPVLVDELSRDQINWLNDYHAHVYEMLSPRLHEDEKVWLKEKCAPIGR